MDDLQLQDKNDTFKRQLFKNKTHIVSQKMNDLKRLKFE